MRKFIGISSSVLIAIQLTSCASVLSGVHQNISIATLPVQGAQCSLENNKGKWNIPKTPGHAVIHKSSKNLMIICEKTGYNKAISEIKPEINKVAYGNIFVGGIIGGAIDNNNGAAFQYPMSVNIKLVPKGMHNKQIKVISPYPKKPVGKFK